MFDKTPSPTRRSTPSLLVSLAIHGVVAIALFTVHFTVRSAMPSWRNTRVQLMAPVAPRPVKRVAVRMPPQPPEIRFAPTIPAPALPAPALPAPAPPAITQPAPVIQAPPVVAEAPKPQAAPARPPVVQTDVFASAAPAKPNPTLPVQVKTGGFSTASASSGESTRPAPVVTAGFGDAAVTTVAGARRQVATGVGFGDAALNAATSPSRGNVRTSGFGDAVVAASSGGGGRAQAPAPVTAAQILEKPRPAYTEEARRLQIEGEVQLEIRFCASGEVHILRVLRGLGYGLDENAVQAARAIRFLPARRDGRPVDSTATVHIIFQLAS